MPIFSNKSTFLRLTSLLRRFNRPEKFNHSAASWCQKQMPRMRFLIVFVIFLATTVGYSQNYVNKYVFDPFGSPIPEIDWSETITDGSGNLITVGNTVTDADNVALYTVKSNSFGQILWQQSWTNPSVPNSKNYGIAVTVDTNDNIVIVGATTPDSEVNADIVALKYKASGTPVWSKIISGSGGLGDIPADVVTDNNGYVYLTGVIQSVSTLTDFYTCKLHYNTGNILWEESIDHNGASGYDVATGIRLNSSGHPVVSGVVSTDGLNWSAKTLEHNAGGGNMQNQNVFETTTTDNEFFTVDLKTDALNNFYLLGQKGNSSSDIQLTKLNENLEEVWSVTYDLSGNKDEAAALTITDGGVIIVTGSAQNSQGRYELVTVAYKPDGVIKWQNRRHASTVDKEVKGVKSTATPSGEIYTAGEIKEGNRSEIVVVKYSAEGEKLWEKRHGSGYDYVTGINYTGDALLVSGKFEHIIELKYYTLRFEEYKKDNPNIYHAGTNKPKNRANEIVVKFSRKALKTENIDNLNLVFGDAHKWLTDDAIEEIGERVNLRNAVFIRIFKNLKTTHTTSLSRLGETIPIPEFWATFIIDFPDGTDLEATIANLTSHFPTVKYAHPNYVAVLANTPDDPDYGIQRSIHSTPGYENAHINVEPFWTEETGKPFVKVGILDSGLDYNHEDFTYEGPDGPTSVMVEGWDFEMNMDLTSISDPDPSAHGTPAAGIIGAVRNNGKGTAGIAGGFPDDDESHLNSKDCINRRATQPLRHPRPYRLDGLYN